MISSAHGIPWISHYVIVSVAFYVLFEFSEKIGHAKTQTTDCADQANLNAI